MGDGQTPHAGDLPPKDAADRHRAEDGGQQDGEPAPAHPIGQRDLGQHVEGLWVSESPLANYHLARVSDAKAYGSTPVKSIRFSKLPRLHYGGVNCFKRGTDDIGGMLAVGPWTIHFNPEHCLPRNPSLCRVYMKLEPGARRA